MTSVSLRRVRTAVTVGLSLALGAAAGFGTLCAGATPAELTTPDASSKAPVKQPSKDTDASPHLDRSGHRQIGKAAYYANRYAGRTMSDGTPMRPARNNAASLTLPLGTTARVTNLATGKSAIITIRDRGPYVKGRIVDLSPATATLIGMNLRQGLALVAVTPLALPGTSSRGKSRVSVRLSS